MEIEIQKDIGEEIIMKLKDLIFKINKLVEGKNEKELSDSSSYSY
jgi:hypothetical protein